MRERDTPEGRERHRHYVAERKRFRRQGVSEMMRRSDAAARLVAEGEIDPELALSLVVWPGEKT